MTEQSEYDNFVKNMAKLDKPVYSIVFASPLRNPAGKYYGIVNFDWWEADSYDNRDGGWRRFYGQTAINQRYGLKTIYYAFTPKPDDPRAGDVFMTNRNLPYKCGLGMFEDLVTITLPYVSQNTLLSKIPDSKPAWLLGAPRDCADERN